MCLFVCLFKLSFNFCFLRDKNKITTTTTTTIAIGGNESLVQQQHQQQQQKGENRKNFIFLSNSCPCRVCF